MNNPDRVCETNSVLTEEVWRNWAQEYGEMIHAAYTPDDIMRRIFPNDYYKDVYARWKAGKYVKP